MQVIAFPQSRFHRSAEHHNVTFTSFSADLSSARELIGHARSLCRFVAGFVLSLVSIPALYSEILWKVKWMRACLLPPECERSEPTKELSRSRFMV